MELTMNMGAFEPLTFDQMMTVDAGRNWVATIAGTVAGVSGIVGGVAGLCLPDPTCASKVIAYSAIVGGISSIVWAWA